jgi:hypothetical protein
VCILSFPPLIPSMYAFNLFNMHLPTYKLIDIPHSLRVINTHTYIYTYKPYHHPNAWVCMHTTNTHHSETHRHNSTSHTHKSAHTHTHTHTHTHAHAHAHAHTHTAACTALPLPLYLSVLWVASHPSLECFPSASHIQITML